MTYRYLQQAFYFMRIITEVIEVEIVAGIYTYAYIRGKPGATGMGLHRFAAVGSKGMGKMPRVKLYAVGANGFGAFYKALCRINKDGNPYTGLM
jgi:hypothetical protein